MFPQSRSLLINFPCHFVRKTFNMRIIWYISLIYCGSVMNFTYSNGWLIQLSQPSRVNLEAPKSGNHVQPQPIHWRTTSHLNIRYIHVNIYHLETTAWPRSKKFHQAAQATARRIPSVSPARSKMEKLSGFWYWCLEKVYSKPVTHTHTCIHTHIYMYMYQTMYTYMAHISNGQKALHHCMYSKLLVAQTFNARQDQGKSPWTLLWETSCGGIYLHKTLRKVQGFSDAPWAYCDLLWLLQFFLGPFFHIKLLMTRPISSCFKFQGFSDDFCI